MIVRPHCVLHGRGFDHEVRPEGETGSNQENKPSRPEQLRRPEQGKQRDRISKKTIRKRIYVRPKRRAAVVETQNVV